MVIRVSGASGVHHWCGAQCGIGCGARCSACRVVPAAAMLILLALLVLPGGVPAVHAAGEAALTVTDPTRPPPEMMALFPASAGAVVLAVPRLQSVMIGSAERSAIIDGQRYKVGDKLGDARLLKISENEVVLAGSGGRQTMTLFTPVKQVPLPEQAAARARPKAPRNP